MEEREQINGITQDVAAALNTDVASVRRAVERMQDICMAELRVPYQYVYTEPSSDVAINHLAPNRYDEEPRHIPSYDEKMEWLRKKGALNRFCKNLSKLSFVDKDSIKKYIEDGKENLISCGFSWCLSDEGHDYWCRKNRLYHAWYNDTRR